MPSTFMVVPFLGVPWSSLTTRVTLSLMESMSERAPLDVYWREVARRKMFLDRCKHFVLRELLNIVRPLPASFVLHL